MDDVKNKLGYLSFAEKSWQELEKALSLLRNVKLRFCLCSENCFDKPEVSLEDWKSVRTSCLEECQAPHTAIFDVFIQRFPDSRNSSARCVYQCESEYAQSKFGEEDQTICEEKCYEEMWKTGLSINQDLRDQYAKIYQEKFNN